jgi:hypothetical protein
VDLEEFKEHSYPDVLVSVLIRSLMEFKKWLDEPAVAPGSKKSFWEKLGFGKPIGRKIDASDAARLSTELQAEIDDLNKLLHSPEDFDRQETRGASASNKAAANASAGVAAGPAEAKATAAVEAERRAGHEYVDHYRSRKIEALQRGVIKYKDLFGRISRHAGNDAFLLLDDLYHIQLDDQSNIIDYFHKMAKGTNLWLKIGTIRHRSEWYKHGNPPMGMKLGDDAEAIDLDVTLEKYQTTKSFLIRILEQFSKEKSVVLGDIMADGARDRLVLASGGVARDFLSLFRRALEEARERVLSGELARGDKVGAEDVNRASGSYYENKTEELNRDAASDRDEIMGHVNRIRTFCLENSKANCLLVEKDFDSSLENAMGELVDLKFVHHVRSRVTVRNREGRLYDAFMLDLSFYTGERARRGFDMIEFWRADNADALRKATLIYAEASKAA